MGGWQYVYFSHFRTVYNIDYYYKDFFFISVDIKDSSVE